MTLRASLVLLGVLCGAFAQPAAAQEYQLNQWHLSLAGGLQARVTREMGGSEWVASWDLPASAEGGAITVEASSRLGRRVATEGQAFLTAYHQEPGECRALAPPPGLGGRRVVLALCPFHPANSYVVLGIVEGIHDGLQVAFGASFHAGAPTDQVVGERLLMNALASIAHLEETRPIAWSDVQCGAFHPAAHPGVPRPSFYCVWDGQNLATDDGCQEPEDHRPWAGCDWTTYTEATFAELNDEARALTVFAANADESMFGADLTLPGLGDRTVYLGVKSRFSDARVSTADLSRLVTFLKNARDCRSRRRSREHPVENDHARLCAHRRGSAGVCARVASTQSPTESADLATPGGRAQRTRGAWGDGCVEQPSGVPGPALAAMVCRVVRPWSHAPRENAGPGRRARHPGGACVHRGEGVRAASGDAQCPSVLSLRAGRRGRRAGGAAPRPGDAIRLLHLHGPPS